LFERKSPGNETLQPDLTTLASGEEMDDIFHFPLVETEKSLAPPPASPPMIRTVRLIFLANPDENKIPLLPAWLHELVGWGVFLAILAGFMGLQIYLNRLLSGVNQAALILSVVAEIGLLWQWDRYWY
jgi:hypothetical protein